MAKLFIKAFTSSPSLLVSIKISPIFPSSYSPVCKYTLWSPIVAFWIYPFLLSGMPNRFPFFSDLLKILVTDFSMPSCFESLSFDIKSIFLLSFIGLLFVSKFLVFLLSNLTSSTSNLPSSLFSRFFNSASFISSKKWLTLKVHV